MHRLSFYLHIHRDFIATDHTTILRWVDSSNNHHHHLWHQGAPGTGPKIEGVGVTIPLDVLDSPAPVANLWGARQSIKDYWDDVLEDVSTKLFPLLVQKKKFYFTQLYCFLSLSNNFCA